MGVGLLTWNRVSSVGVRAMDQQHGVLMDTLHDIRQAVMQGAGRERVTRELSRLLEFTRQHFLSEERLLEQMGFPALEHHREAHARLLKQLQSLLERAKHGNGAQMQAAAVAPREWFVDHIEQMDANYGEWLNERGIL
jgi:hemerythrin